VADEYPERTERVLLVVDGDNAEATLRECYNTQMDWGAFRAVIPRAASLYHQIGQVSRLYTPVGEVTEAHMFKTVVPLRTGESNAQYQARRAKIKAGIQRAGYEPHVEEPGWDSAAGKYCGYPDQMLLALIEQKMPYFDTLILVTSDADFWPVAEAWHKLRTRVFLVSIMDHLTTALTRPEVPFVDLARVQITFTSVLRPLRGRLLAEALPTAV
jgi:hypothetical protein